MAKPRYTLQGSLLRLPAGSACGNGGNLSHPWEPLWFHGQRKPQSIVLVASGVASGLCKPARPQVPKPLAWWKAPRLQQWVSYGMLFCC